MVPVEWYLLLAAGVFCVGLFGVLTRRDALYFLMSVELMMNAANVNFVAFALFVIALAAAEVAVGIGIILVLYRNFGDIDVTVPAEMRW